MGASWVQRQILEEHPHSDIKVYVVWFDMLSGDSREGWDGYLVPDSRATNLWDEDRLTSAALGTSVKALHLLCGTPTYSTGRTLAGARPRPRPSAREPRSTRRGKSSRKTSYRFSARVSRPTSLPTGVVSPARGRPAITHALAYLLDRLVGAKGGGAVPHDLLAIVPASVASYTPPLTRCSRAPERSRVLSSLKPPTGRWSTKT
jgi:hypothetical protein